MNDTFETLCTQWLVSMQGVVKNNTYSNTYKNSVKNHIVPHFKNKKVSEIMQSDIQAFLTLQSTKYCIDTVKKDKSCLFQFFDFCIDNNYYFRANPVRHIKLSDRAESDIFDKPIYTPQQMNLLFEYGYCHRFGYEIQILLETGICRAELLGLKWENVDLENKIIYIKHNLTEDYSSGKPIELGIPKNKFRFREIPISERLCLILKSHIHNNSDFVVCNKYCKPCVPSNWYRRHYLVFMKSAREFYKNQCDIPILSAHRLRHSCASAWVNSDKNLYAISKILGHSDLEMLRKRYAHSDVEQLRNLLGIK